MAGSNFFTIDPYKTRRDSTRISVTQKYDILGYIAAGTYGKVYKAKTKNKSPTQQQHLFAIKKFKSDSKDNEVIHYTGISQSAIREISLCRELNNRNITKLSEIILERKCIYMVFEFAEHDLLQIIHFHSHPNLKPIPEQTLKSIMFQILNGVNYLHQNWVLHRDLKPANIMVTAEGVVKIGDLGLARRFNNPLQSLYAGDKVVVTIWYRAPELLLGARHYTPAIDLWSIGCILAELLSLRPMFKGEEAKIDNKKQVPFQENQMLKILEILGTPSLSKWTNLADYPEYSNLVSRFSKFPNNLQAWYHSIGGNNKNCFKLLGSLLEYDPSKRVNAFDAMDHQWFKELPRYCENIFEGSKFTYPVRKIQKDDNDILTGNVISNINNSVGNNGTTGNNTGSNNNNTKRGYNNNLGKEDLRSRKKQR
ncbi:hypothetical protein PACTADRAFT_45117 [Pachysolen tannophilus NRRL Y-2460]|uniref:Cyclin-dependent kinase 8 n=1 Tax=Pachysolen tannophilus NRRL Y-2460 TaxID=669874 RepID=A0A1E4TR16_PACTA|nr:hypothetical protein PACTADRAFT_45117 [Pachysolen tannophilus NRRL Y-2460]